MIEIILLYFLCKHIGRLALSKGLKPLTWKIYTILAWIAAEFLGIIFGAILFGVNLESLKYTSELSRLMLFSLACAFGGYLFIRKKLENLPDQ